MRFPSFKTRIKVKTETNEKDLKENYKMVQNNNNNTTTTNGFLAAKEKKDRISGSGRKRAKYSSIIEQLALLSFALSYVDVST